MSARVLLDGYAVPSISARSWAAGSQGRTCSQRGRRLIQTGTDFYRLQLTEDERGPKKHPVSFSSDVRAGQFSRAAVNVLRWSTSQVCTRSQRSHPPRSASAWR